MDETTPTPSTEPPPQITPLDWSALDPKLAAALVEAQALIESVPVDSQHGQGYKYASLSAIVSHARRAMTASGIILVTDGWSVDGSTLHVEYIIVHKSGSTSPVIRAVMPIVGRGDPTKALSASMSTARKYMLAGLLNMDWTDPGTDIDSVHGPASDSDKSQRQSQRSPRPQVQRGPSDAQVAHTKLLSDARSWGKRLVSLGVSSSRILSYATGIQGDMPKPTPSSILRAICMAGNALNNASTTEDGPQMDSHAMLLTAIAQSKVQILWSHGKITPTGESVDQAQPIA